MLSVVKGLERGTLLRMSEVIAEAGGIDPARIAALSGPNLAAEIARGLPASAVVAAPTTRRWRAHRRRGSAAATFRLYVNRDILGVELCGALKNIIAIAAGAADGLGFGDNGKAGLMTRGLAEMIRLGLAAGANPLTFAGLAGHRRRDRDVRVAAVAQPPPRRGAGEGPAAGPRSRPTPAGRRPRAPTRSRPPWRWPIGSASRCRSRRRSTSALFEGKSVQRCLIDLLSRESKDELADLA